MRFIEVSFEWTSSNCIVVDSKTAAAEKCVRISNAAENQEQT